MEDEEYYYEEDDNRFISENERRYQYYHFSENTLLNGSKQGYRCPCCGSYNTEQGTYYDKCNTCGDFQGY